jgi:hypothetical protein
VAVIVLPEGRPLDGWEEGGMPVIVCLCSLCGSHFVDAGS